MIPSPDVKPWHQVAQLLRHDWCQGCGPIQILTEADFYDEDGLPFEIASIGTVVHVIPEPGFRKENLAGSEDERLLIADCPDDEGWLVPEDVIANWLNRNIECPDLEDLILAHPLYEYLTRPDEEGRSRGGHRGNLLQWAPGIPNLASIYAPEWLPTDPDAPLVNRDRTAYVDAVEDLLRQLEVNFKPLEVEVGVRFGQNYIERDEWGEADIGDAADDEDVDDAGGGARVHIG